MAFNMKNLTTLGNTGKRGESPVLYVYYNKDSDTVTAAGYMDKDCGIVANDKVMVITATAANNPVWHYATVSTSGAITLTACSDAA